MEIKINIPQTNIIAFLQEKGYEVKSFSYSIPENPKMAIHTFTATKPDEIQTKERDYVKVFEKEINKLLKINTY